MSAREPTIHATSAHDLSLTGRSSRSRGGTLIARGSWEFDCPMAAVDPKSGVPLRLLATPGFESPSPPGVRDVCRVFHRLAVPQPLPRTQFDRDASFDLAFSTSCADTAGAAALQALRI